jgi:CelD/BcsL family acetyltransferase involved in cellulose biosynthesis/glycosyltransferase involved in cell wall biosynthesis
VKLLFASDVLALPGGGAERAMLEWVEGLRTRGHEVRVVSLDPLERPGDERYWRWRASHRAASAERVAAALAARGADVVVAQMHGAPGALRAATAAGIPTVLALPSYELLCKLAFDVGSECPPGGDCVSCPAARRLCEEERAALLGSRRANARALARAAAVVVPSDAVARAVERWTGRSPSVVRPIAPPLPSLAAHRWDGPVLCVAARWSPAKGAALLPELAAAVRGRGRRFHVTEAGLDERECEALVGAGATLVPNAPFEELAAECGLLIVPSQWEEPFGRVAWEAMARGIPVLASDAGGLAEQVPPELRVAPREQAAAWEGAIARVLGDESAWRSAASAARGWAAALIEPPPLDRLESVLRDASEGGLPSGAPPPSDAVRAAVGSQPAVNGREPRVSVEPIGDLGEARALWERLERQAGNPFATWMFADAWWRHIGAGRPLRLVAVSAGDRVVALLPLLEAASELRLVGYGDADLLGPVGDPASHALALAALRDYVRREGIRFVANDVAAGSAQTLGGELVRTTPSPLVELPADGWEALLASRSANLRGGVRNKESRLSRAHAVRVRAATSTTLGRDLEILFALHNARWSNTTTVFSGPRVAMHRELARRAMERGWLRLRVLELDGRPVAATYGFRVGEAEWNYQHGRAPAFERASVGFVMYAATIRAACEEGAREFRMLRGAQRYKLSWASGDAPVETVLVEGS